MDTDTPRHSGGCHCGVVRFQVHLSDGFQSIRRCSCSYCRMRGAIAVSARLEDITISQGHDSLTLYQFNTDAAKHFFCKVCGIYTHHQRRSQPALVGINVACLDGISPFDFPEVQVMDGIAHPSDTGTTARAMGLLRFTLL